MKLITLLLFACASTALGQLNPNQLSGSLSIKSGALLTNASIVSDDGTPLLNVGAGGNLRLRQANGEVVLDANGASLNDIDTGVASIVWGNRTLNDTSGEAVLNWEDKTVRAQGIGGTETPLVAAIKSGSGTGATITVTGSSIGGGIELASGTGTASNALLATIQFQYPSDQPRFVILSPANYAAASLAMPIYTQSTVTNFSLYSTITLPSQTVFKWHFIAVE